MAWDDEDDSRTRRLALLTAGTLAAGCLVGVYYYWRGQNAPPTYSTAGFDVSQVESQPEAAPTYAPPPPRQVPASSPAPILGAGFSVSSNNRAAAPKFVKNAPPPEQLKAEQEWLKRYGGMLYGYNRGLRTITRRHYQSSPVVREVDKAFGAMPRYMAVRDRYMKEGNPFAFARDSLALPEVRSEIAKRMTDPRVWKESVTMILETLRSDPPPAVLYQEMKRFMTKDPTMVDYLPEFTGQVTRNVGTAMQGIPQGADLGPLQKVMHDVAPPATPALPQPASR